MNRKPNPLSKISDGRILEDLMNQSRQTKKDLIDLKDELFRNAREAVEHGGWYRPIVIALSRGDKLKHFIPSVHSFEAKEFSYEKINRALKQYNPRGVAHAAQMVWVPNEELTEDERPAEHPNARPALVVTLHAPGWTKTFVQEFEFSEDGDPVFKDVEETDSRDNRIDVFDDVS